MAVCHFRFRWDILRQIVLRLSGCSGGHAPIRLLEHGEGLPGGLSSNTCHELKTNVAELKQE